jgi:predicted nucleotidyltransferase
MSALHALITSKVRIQILKTMALSPEGAFNINELSRLTGFSPRGVEKELKNLLSGGILKREILGNQHRYQLDPRGSVNKEIKSIILKTVGISRVIKKALTPVEQRIELAFVFGSFASGEYGNESDVDLFIVSDMTGVELAELLGPVQDDIGRPINVSQFSPAEFRSRKQEGDHFVKHVFKGPFIEVLGSLDES